MSTSPEILESGRVRLLWKSGSHDGMAAAVGLLDGHPVYVDAYELGHERLTKPWQDLEQLMEKLLEEDDFENIWDRIERKYGAQMRETLDRAFDLRALPSDEFDSLLEDRRRWQLHAGLGSDYWYGEDGKPQLAQPSYWPVARAYLDAHYYKQVEDWFARRSRLQAYPVVGRISRATLYAPSDLRVARPEDPRTDDLKVYQATWREGDLVRTEW